MTICKTVHVLNGGRLHQINKLKEEHPTECLMMNCGLDVEPELNFQARGNKPKEEKMKTMKTVKTCCALIGAATVLTTPNLFATVQQISLQYVYPANGGLPGGPGPYVASTTTLGTFQTFCLAENVEFHQGQTYNYTVSGSANPGGISGGNPDPISIGTAWLYSQFRAGTLLNYAYDQTTGVELQQAIWWLEGETGFGVKNLFVTEAESALSLTDSTIINDANGAYGVVALNLTDANGNPSQPQLAIVPEASTMIAGALLLLPMGVSALRIVRKNRVA